MALWLEGSELYSRMGQQSWIVRRSHRIHNPSYDVIILWPLRYCRPLLMPTPPRPLWSRVRCVAPFLCVFFVNPECLLQLSYIFSRFLLILTYLLPPSQKDSQVTPRT